MTIAPGALPLPLRELVVQTMQLVALPIELLVSIIGHLDFRAVLRCREVSVLAR